MKLSILIPTYNGQDTLKETLGSILRQNFSDFEVVIQDDASTDDTENIVKLISDKRIKFYKNMTNLGYPANIEEGRKHISGDILFLMGQDDILSKDALSKTFNAFQQSEDIGAVARPYYWFDKSIMTPVRAKKRLNSQKNVTMTINSDYDKLITVFSTLDQLSGLAFRVKYFNTPFHSDIFPCHVYPFAHILKEHPIVFLKDYTVAVRIRSSQSRHISSIYEKSPIQTWVNLFNNVYPEREFKIFRHYMIENFVAKNYIGLVQIKNYAKYKYLLRECIYLLRYRWKNIYNPVFWLFTATTILVPPIMLIPLVDWYKNTIHAHLLNTIDFQND